MNEVTTPFDEPLQHSSVVSGPPSTSSMGLGNFEFTDVDSPEEFPESVTQPYESLNYPWYNVLSFEEQLRLETSCYGPFIE